MLKRVCRLALAVGASLLASSPGFTVPNSFHLMQIEQVIGGVGGNVNLQAIQLRMRSSGQNLVSFTRVRAWNALGMNPVVIVDMTTDVAGANTGDRILIASPQFAAAFPGAPPDFLMTTLMPASFFPAGKITFEDDSGTSVYWSLAWGGAGYTGTNTGTMDNDADGIFNPPFGGPLPSSNNQALRFPGLATAMSTNNLADYALTAGNAVFTNNAGQSITVPVEAMDFFVR
jgi:hypothetical protein